jgi:hypothetical protein
VSVPCGAGGAGTCAPPTPRNKSLAGTLPSEPPKSRPDSATPAAVGVAPVGRLANMSPVVPPAPPSNSVAVPLPTAGSDTLPSLDRAVVGCAPLPPASFTAPPPNSADAAPTLSLVTRTTERAAGALPPQPLPPPPPPPSPEPPALLEPPAVKNPEVLEPWSAPSADGREAAVPAATAGAADDPPKKLAAPRSGAVAAGAAGAGAGDANCSALRAGAAAGVAAPS